MESRDYLEMTFRSIDVFADDGKLDASELGELINIAMRDGKIDDNERRVLGAILDRVRPEEIDEALRNKIVELQDYLEKS